jgi:acyl carrier protein
MVVARVASPKTTLLSFITVLTPAETFRRSLLTCAEPPTFTKFLIGIERPNMKQDPKALKLTIKQMMVDNLMLQTPAEQIPDDQPLFGPGGIGLDSVDALQLVVALDKQFGLKITDPDEARKVLRDTNSIADAVDRLQTSLL